MILNCVGLVKEEKAENRSQEPGVRSQEWHPRIYGGKADGEEVETAGGRLKKPNAASNEQLRTGFRGRDLSPMN
jgi:hypothetical protein